MLHSKSILIPLLFTSPVSLHFIDGRKDKVDHG